ncbi:MAG TPA: S8 family serine peptidase [Pyrinomonadaceae bacterium]|jgi:subtilisin family serine protease|nr:S8 family serine peptidase [Pyrinomonadaceae bacterium]
MNRQNFFGHLALALTLVLLAGFAGQIRRWQNEKRAAQRAEFEFNQGVETVAANVDEDKVGQTKSGKAEVLVRFRPSTSLVRIKALAFGHNDRMEDKYESVTGLVAIEDEDGLDAEKVASEYSSLPDVEYAEPVFQVQADHGLPGDSKHKHANDPMFGNQWSLENTGQDGGKSGADIGVLRAWFKTTGSSKVVVAVLDSGVDYTHFDLMNNIWLRPADMAPYSDDELGKFNDLHGFNATDRWTDPMDDNGHGTHCAGIIGAEGDNGKGIAGINWNVEIMPLKFLSSTGSGSTKDAIEAINYVIDRKNKGVNVRIISASWGSTQKSRALRDAIKKAGDEGILFVAAAGNNGDDSDKRPHYPAGYYDLPNVVSVAALDRNDQLASFSNYGAKSVQIAAPGKEILSTWLNGEFYVASGTSMATPEVAGVAALILSTNPKMSVKELRDRLFNSVDKLDSLKGKVATGGRINAAKAVGVE